MTPTVSRLEGLKTTAHQRRRSSPHVAPPQATPPPPPPVASTPARAPPLPLPWGPSDPASPLRVNSRLSLPVSAWTSHDFRLGKNQAIFLKANAGAGPDTSQLNSFGTAVTAVFAAGTFKTSRQAPAVGRKKIVPETRQIE